MSLPSYHQANVFLSPLHRKVTVFLVDGRTSHTLFAQFLLNYICVLNKKLLILDTDAFYASNSNLLVTRLSEECLGRVALTIPAGDTIQTTLTSSVFSSYEFLIIDDLNTIYHLMSTENRSAIRELTALTRVLSYFCRENDITVILVAYSAGEGLKREASKRSLFHMGDVSVSTKVNNDKIQFTCDYGKAWSDNTFSASF